MKSNEDIEWTNWKQELDRLGSEMVHVSWWGFVYEGVDHGDVPEERFDETLRWQLKWWKSSVGERMRTMCKQEKAPMGSKSGVDRARAALRRTFDKVEARLAAGSAKSPPERYLSGATFGVYDLSFCALVAFAVLPPE